MQRAKSVTQIIYLGPLPSDHYLFILLTNMEDAQESCHSSCHDVTFRNAIEPVGTGQQARSLAGRLGPKQFMDILGAP